MNAIRHDLQSPTFLDASVFLLVFPAIELLDYLHGTGTVAVLLRLY